jgi:hypothetical protein
VNSALKTRSRRTYLIAFAILCATVIAGLIIAVEPTVTNPPQSMVIVASADTYVSESDPTSEHGDDLVLRVDSVPDRFVALVSFEVPTASDPLINATLRIHARTPSIWGTAVAKVENDFPRESTTWRTRPGSTDLAGLLPPTTDPGWIDLDLTEVTVAGERLSLALFARGPTMVTFDSRESPELGLLLIFSP